MNNTNATSIKSSEIEIIENVYKLEMEQEKNEKSSSIDNKSRNSENLNKTDEAFVPIADSKKDGDKINENDARRDFVVYGYYVREPIWVNMESGGGGFIGDSYDPSSRNSFIGLVFLIVFAMLVATAVWGALCMTLDILIDLYMSFGYFILMGSAIIMISMSYAMACSSCTRRVPCNIICLVIAVIGMSLMVGYFTVRYEAILVLFGVVATAAVVLVCFLLAFTSFDFTKWLLYVVVIGVVIAVLFLCVMVARLITGEMWPILTLVLLVASTVVHAVMLTIEIQIILGGKAIELDENDYALGAYLIYTSIMDLFIKLMQIFGIMDSIF